MDPVFELIPVYPSINKRLLSAIMRHQNIMSAYNVAPVKLDKLSRASTRDLEVEGDVEMIRSHSSIIEQLVNVSPVN